MKRLFPASASLRSPKAPRVSGQCFAGLEALEPRNLLTALYLADITSISLPAHPVAGIAAKGTAKLVLTNHADNGLLATDKADYHIVAHITGAGDSTGDVEIGLLLNQKIGLAVGASKPLTINLNLPATLSAHTYDIIISAAKSAPAGTTMFTTTAPTGFTEETPTLDLAISLGSSTIPTSLISSAATVGTLPITLTNVGNINAAATEKASIHLFAHPVGGGADIPLTTKTPLTGQSIAKLKPGASKTFKPQIIFPQTVTTGDYVIVASVMDEGPTSEYDAGNDLAQSVATISVTQGFLDFSPTLVSAALPPPIVQGTSAKGSIKLNLNNLGNIPSDAADKITFVVVAHPTGGGADIPLNIPSAQSIAKLKALTGNKPFTLALNFAATMPSASYAIIVSATASGPDADASASNNSFTLASNVTIAAPFVDLNIPDTKTALSGNIVGGTSGPVTVTLGNLGNIPSTGYLVEVFATTNGTIPSGAIPIGSASSATAKIAPGGTLKVPLTVTLPVENSNTPLSLVARVTLAADNQANNNTATVVSLTATPLPPALGNEPSSITFAEKTNNPIGNIQTTTTGDVTHPGHALPQGDFYHYSTYNVGGETKLGHLLFAVSPYLEVNLLLKFTGTRLVSLDGKTIVFLTTSAGSTGTFTVQGANPVAGVTDGQTGFFKII